ncbi:hypothetical protein HU200_029415 [Digitaria exilis]|uniref:Uncharacterized protein n=1 Tax=Digitaria exilis TaxID=1010633 RepID=A0A835EPH9_9POAL|nr:hypothetical protein HU200_029415 [Digitaria exilis]
MLLPYEMYKGRKVPCSEYLSSEHQEIKSRHSRTSRWHLL